MSIKMIHKRSIYYIFLLFCGCLVLLVTSVDEFEKMEKEMQLNPPGKGNASDEAAISSKVQDKTITNLIDTEFESIQNQLIDKTGQSDPYLKLNKDGIKVYIYNSKNSDFATFKATVHINTSLDSILAVMFDNESAPEWIDGCEDSFILEDVSFTERYHYQTINIPYPFTDRDFIFHSTLKQDPRSKAITITMSAVEEYCNKNPSRPCEIVNQSGLVRVTKSIGTYKLEPDENGIKITWVQHTDPMGNIPAWLVNQLIQDTPYWTFKQLAKKVREEKYKYAQLIYNERGFATKLIYDELGLATKINTTSKRYVRKKSS